MSLRAKVLLGLSPLLVALGVTVVVGSKTTTELAHSSWRIINENYLSVVASQRMKVAVERLDRAAVLRVSGSPAPVANDTGSARALFEEQLRIEDDNITEPGEAEAAARLGAAWQECERPPRYVSRSREEPPERLLLRHALAAVRRGRSRRRRHPGHESGRDAGQERFCRAGGSSVEPHRHRGRNRPLAFWRSSLRSPGRRGCSGRSEPSAAWRGASGRGTSARARSCAGATKSRSSPKRSTTWPTSSRSTARARSASCCRRNRTCRQPSTACRIPSFSSGSTERWTRSTPRRRRLWTSTPENRPRGGSRPCPPDCATRSRKCATTCRRARAVSCPRRSRTRSGWTPVTGPGGFSRGACPPMTQKFTVQLDHLLSSVL